MSSSTAQKPKTTSFVEEQIREGFEMADIQMWQKLCKNVSILRDDSEETMHGILTICDNAGVSPLAVCAQMRELGFPTCEQGIESALEHFFSKESRVLDGRDEEAADDVDEDGDQPDEVDDDDAEEAISVMAHESAKRAKTKSFQSIKSQLDEDF